MALETHIRLLWGLYSQADIPKSVSAEEKRRYAARFDDENAVKASVQSSLTSNSTSIAGVDNLIAKMRKDLPPSGTIAGNIRRISEEFLQMTFRTSAQQGLQRWAPDIETNDPDSIYNVLNEHIAVRTFQQASTGSGYAFFPINLKYVNDSVLLCRLYRSFVFHHMRDLFRMENKAAGAVERNQALANVYLRRSTVRLFFFSSSEKKINFPTFGIYIAGKKPLPDPETRRLQSADLSAGQMPRGPLRR